MKSAPEKLKADLKKKLAPIYLIAGEQPLLVAEAADLVRTHAQEAGFGDREIHVVERGFDWPALQSGMRNLSLFAERRIVELRLPDAKPGADGSRALVALAEDPAPDALLLVIAGRIDRKAAGAKWVKALSAAGVFVPVGDVPPARLPQWVQRRMRERGLEVATAGARIVADRCEGNLLAADQEIEKLLLINGPGKVDDAAVMQSVTDSARFDVFQLGDAALVGDTRRAIRILNGLLAEGVAVPLILWALDRELRTLARIAWLVAGGTSLTDAMAGARVWSSRRALVRRALDRHRQRGAFDAMLAIAGRADRMAKGVEYGDAAAELTRLVATLSGTALPRPLPDVA